MNECENWIIKKVEHQRIDAFKLWCWRRLLRVPWTARRSNQSILKEINPEYSLEGLMLKLKLQYFGHQMWRGDSLGKNLMLGKIDGRRRRQWTDDEIVGWHHQLNGHEFWANSRRQRKIGKPGVLQSMGSQRVRHDLVNEQQLVGQQSKLTDDRRVMWGGVKTSYTWNRIWFQKITMYIKGKRCVWRKLQKIFIKGNVCLWGVSNRLLRFLEHISISKMFYHNMCMFIPMYL